MTPSLLRSNFLNRISVCCSLLNCCCCCCGFNELGLRPARLGVNPAGCCWLAMLDCCGCWFFGNEEVVEVEVPCEFVCCCCCCWLAAVSAAAWLEFSANLPMRSCIELTILPSSSRVTQPSRFRSYSVKIQRNCSSIVPLVNTDKPITKSVNVISCFRWTSNELKTKRA